MAVNVHFSGSAYEVMLDMREFLGLSPQQEQTTTQAPTMLAAVVTAEKKTRSKAVPAPAEQPATPPAENMIDQEPPAAEAPAPTVTVTIEEIRAAAQVKVQEGKQPKLRALLEEYNAKSVSAIYSEQYGEFFTKLQAL